MAAPVGSVAPMSTTGMRWRTAPTAPSPTIQDLLSLPPEIDVQQLGSVQDMLAMTGIAPYLPSQSVQEMIQGQSAPPAFMTGGSSPSAAPTPTAPPAAASSPALPPSGAAAAGVFVKGAVPKYRELPEGVEPGEVLPVPVRDLLADKKRSENAQRLALLGPLAALLTGGSVSNAAGYAPVNLAAALQGAEFGNDKRFGGEVQARNAAQQALDASYAQEINQYKQDTHAVEVYNQNEDRRVLASDREADRQQDANKYAATQGRLYEGLDLRAAGNRTKAQATLYGQVAALTPENQSAWWRDPSNAARAEEVGLYPLKDKKGGLLPFTRRADEISQARLGYLQGQSEASLALRARGLKETIRYHDMVDNNQDAARESLNEYRETMAELGKRRTDISESRLSIARTAAGKTKAAKDPSARLYALNKELLTLNNSKAKAVNPDEITLQVEDAMPGSKATRQQEIGYYDSRLGLVKSEIARLQKAGASAPKARSVSVDEPPRSERIISSGRAAPAPAPRAVATPIGRISNQAAMPAVPPSNPVPRRKAASGKPRTTKAATDTSKMSNTQFAKYYAKRVAEKFGSK